MTTGRGRMWFNSWWYYFLCRHGSTSWSCVDWKLGGGETACKVWCRRSSERRGWLDASSHGLQWQLSRNSKVETLNIWMCIFCFKCSCLTKWERQESYRFICDLLQTLTLFSPVLLRYLLSKGASTEAENESGEKPADLIDPDCKELVNLFETGCVWRTQIDPKTKSRKPESPGVIKIKATVYRNTWTHWKKRDWAIVTDPVKQGQKNKHHCHFSLLALN